MKQMIRQVPIPIAGVMLGLTALGNLLQGYSEAARGFCGALAALFGVLLLLKFCLFREQVKQEMENPVIASVSATIFMSVMQLSTYAFPYIGKAAVLVWGLAVAGHLCLILWYTKRFLLRFRLEEVFPTCFVTYVGIIVGSITSATFGMEAVGRWLFWFGFCAYGIMFPVISCRYLRRIPVAEAAAPLFCIYTAPMSLSLTGYLAVMEHPSLTFVLALEILAQALYGMVLTRLPRFLKLPFYPSYASFTFPFVITAFALKKTLERFAAAGIAVPAACSWLLAAETAAAVLLVSYTVARFILHLSGLCRRQKTAEAAESGFWKKTLRLSGKRGIIQLSE